MPLQVKGEILDVRRVGAYSVLSITAPVTTIVLARAALFRRRQAGDDLPAPLKARR